MGRNSGGRPSKRRSPISVSTTTKRPSTCTGESKTATARSFRFRSSSGAATRSNRPPSGSDRLLPRSYYFSDGGRGSVSSLYPVALLNPAFAAALGCRYYRLTLVVA